MTFAGSPDRARGATRPGRRLRVETFRVSGLPRQPGAAMVRSLWSPPRAPPPAADHRAAPARRRARRRRLRRRPDGGRRVARRDSSGADRGRRAFRPRQPPRGTIRESRLSRLSHRRAATGPKYRVIGRPVPRARVRSTGDAPPPFRPPSEGPVVLVFGGTQGGARPERGRDRRFRRRRARRPPSLRRERLSRRSSGSALPAGLQATPVHRRLRRSTRGRRPRRRAGRRLLWEVAAAGKPALLVPLRT